MGKPPAPMWANIFEGLHELEVLPRWKDSVIFYVRFIDDVYGIWAPTVGSTLEHNKERWEAFKADDNNDHGLQWEFTKREMSTTFLDMNVRIQADGEIKTTLHEKPMALYLFIPPHSAHPPGVLTGHIFGNILRVFRLNSDEQDMINDSIFFAASSNGGTAVR